MLFSEQVMFYINDWFKQVAFIQGLLGRFGFISNVFSPSVSRDTPWAVSLNI